MNKYASNQSLILVNVEKDKIKFKKIQNKILYGENDNNNRLSTDDS